MSARVFSSMVAGLIFLLAFTSSSASAPANTLRWKVEGERGVFGFLVYRSSHPQGPFRRVTADIVPATGNLRYAVIDDDVHSGETWHYVIYSVGTNGVKQPLSPVVAKQTR